MDVTEEAFVRCANPECKVAENGRCIEGIADLQSCTHYGKALVIVDRPASPATRKPVPGVSLPGAEAMARGDVQLMLRNQPCNVVAIVGPVGSGKTSLIAGAFDLFQQGPVDGFSFAGSSTLHSFEQACHDTRRASKQKTPMMERTQTGDATFFHLDLVPDGCKGKRSALLANRSGEDYMEVQTTPALAEQFFELHRADTITVLADGKHLLDSGLRHQVKDDICLTLRAFQESGATRPWQRLAVVLTKLDAVREGAGKSERALQNFERILEDVRKQFTQHFRDIQSFHVAASPQSPSADRGEGMVELLRYWMSEPARLQPVSVPVVIPTAARSFGKLAPLASNGHE
ncbi:TRAFAC clade GTPase domain-containing protein [Chitinimonas sp. BJB300]|uniref:TRAFAC clade GTPase domain-containing protein n=1 Tax=Chitinimonas sp. BJB300 TaxID=1559339 RepID=UPI000C122B2D|nr:hypothetical protein [Chitinimonas sp. BJB300]TSJ83291.1 hypothetical protein FG002_021265 [Chitinimonas sp. BJB300]